MYVLQRNGDVFEMRHETSETVPGPVVSAPLLWAGGTTGAGRRAAWEAFIRTGEITDNSLPKPIADSWRRCRDMGVDPLMPRCAEFAPAGQVEPQAAVYAELAAQVERRAYEQVRRKGLLITVAEAHGRILRTCGSKEVLLQADNLHFGPGAVWSEQSVGTRPGAVPQRPSTRPLGISGAVSTFPARPRPTTVRRSGSPWAQRAKSNACCLTPP